MRSTAVHSGALEQLVAALRTGACDEAAAQELYALGSEAVALALLAAARTNRLTWPIDSTASCICCANWRKSMSTTLPASGGLSRVRRGATNPLKCAVIPRQ
ncbi:MAG: hypothetical protein JNG88_15585 [Phycisphaerales bacterium]|nr:hypothetical protein [Phycisphaerales bacterium]